jgi:hypothetical protein
LLTYDSLSKCRLNNNLHIRIKAIYIIKTGEKMKKKVDISRRNFLKSSLVVGGTGLALGMAGCAPKVADQAATAEAASAASAASSVANVDWMGVEPEISDVAETIESDVIVIGAGTGGQYVSASCLEKGLKVIVLDKN